MKVLQLNSICGNGSTGKIVTDLHDVLIEKGNECKIAYGLGSASRVDLDDTFYFGSKIDYYIHNLASRFTDRAGFYSRIQTKKLVEFIDSYNPDLIHIHNIHGFFLNIELLFNALKSGKRKVVWTLHDCWPFTGHCAHYSDNNCYKWRTQCFDCQAKNRYPKSYFFSQAKRNFEDKRRIFLGVADLEITTPSKWLKNQVEESFLGHYPVTVVNNGIDLNVFKYKSNDFKEKYGLASKKIILGVSSAWIPQKGFSDFVKLSRMLSDDYVIVIVGMEPNKELPPNIIVFPTIYDQTKLVEVYSAADVYVSFSVEETFGIPTIEAIACGTPVVTYDKTALPEPVNDKCGIVVKAGDVESVYMAIKKCTELNRVVVSKEAERYDRAKKYDEFIEIYQRMI